MITLHRQRYRYWCRLITFIVIISFIPQNIAWAAPTLKRETLAPGSRFFNLASRLDLEMAGIGHYFEQEIKRYNKENSPRINTISDLFNKLLKRNKYQILDDLNRYDINTIFYPDRIELISPRFTLLFLDSSQYPETGFYQIPGTNIRMDLYPHTHLLPPPSPSSIPEETGLAIEKITRGDMVGYAATVNGQPGAGILGKPRADGYFAILAINKIEDLEIYKGIGLKLLIRLALDTRNQIKGISGITDRELAESMAKYFGGATVEQIDESSSKVTIDFLPNKQLLDDIEFGRGLFSDKSLEELSFQELVDILLSYKRTLSTETERVHERVIITNRKISGINTISIPKGQRIAVIEISPGDHLHFAGNFISNLQGQNEVQFFGLENLGDLRNQLSSFRPDIIILPENIPELDRMIEDSPFEYILIHYENGFAENAYFYIPKDDMEIAKEAIMQYRSQIERTAYHEFAELFARYTGSKTNQPYALPFVVTEIKDGELEDIDPTMRYALDIDTRLPLVTISPHIDDMAIAVHGLVRHKLKKTNSGAIGVIDLVFPYSERGVPGEETIEGKRAIRIAEDRNAKKVLEKGTPGRIETEYFGFNLKDEAQYEQQVQRVVDYFNEFCQQYGEHIAHRKLITITLPHPEDSHPTHRKTTQITLEVLKRISKEKGIRINILFYKTPWSGNYNTFYVSEKDTSGNETVRLGKKAFTRAIGELAGSDFAVRSPSPEELGGEFTERFRRSHHVPKKYIDGVDNQRLESALSKEKIIQSHSGIRINFGKEKNALADEEKIIGSLYAYNYLGFIYNDIARAQGKPPEKLSFVVGYDPRPTTEALLETQLRGFLAAAKSLGVELEIINLGMLPKPMYQNAVRSFQANGGVYLTASHNELNWNGLEYATKYKMDSTTRQGGGIERGFTFGGSLLNAEESRELIMSFSDSIRKLVSGDLSIIGEINNTWPVFEVDKNRYEVAKQDYRGFISSKFGHVSGVKVVLDPNGGAGCGIYKEILEELGFTVVEVNSEIGKPGHRIDPEKDTTCYTELAKIISREGALFGMTFDYDGDRAYLTMLDFQGNPLKISPQDTAAMNVATVLKWCKVNNKLTSKTAIVVNDATSGRVIEIAKEFDVEVFYVEVGETNLVNRMHELRKEGYFVPVAVEGSNGGTIFFDSMCRDGLLSTISVALRETMREIREPIPQYYTESDEISDLDISIRDMKMRIEKFINENPVGFYEYEVHYFEGTGHIINKSKIPGYGMKDETGGWKLVLRTMDGEEHFIWLRPSKTEPNIVRIEFDSPEKEIIPKLRKIFHLATMEKRYTVSGDSDELSHKAAEYFVNEVNRLIEEKGRAVVCLATGGTPREMYRIIREKYRDAVDWSRVIAFHLDEYVFSPEEYPLRKCRYSYRYFLQEEIFKYLPIPKENIHFLNETDPFDEKCYKDEFLEEIEKAGGIDLCILGIGKNGHIAFDEPGSAFDSTIRKVKLKFSTRWANRKAFGKWWQFWSVFKVPRYAFTLGIKEIMASKKIMLLAREKDKTEAVQKSLFGPVTEEVPASILQRHPDVRYFLDKKAFGLNENADEVEELGYRIFGHMPKANFVRRVFNPNWWRDKAMYWGMRVGPIKRWLMKMINKYPTLPIYKKIPLFWFGLGMRFIAPRFIAGDTVKKVTENIMRLKDKKIDYTVDILGEAVTDEKEAEENKDKYKRLLEELTDFTGPVNLSLKLTGLVSKLDQEHKEIVKRRLREILRKAIELDAFVTIDMEQYCYKVLTLKIYTEILEEPEFEKCNNLQIVIQTYLRDSPKDIEEFIKWAKSRYERTGARASVRLVKGAYWDKEVQWAKEEKEERRPSPVWGEKWQTDRNYEDMTALLLQNHQYIQTVFATHNVRSMARVIYEAQKNKIPKDEIEFQMLYGMGEPFQDALVTMGYRVRAYVPYGPLLKGLKYFARRIEENTSQESFLLQSLSGKYKPSELLKEPGPSIKDYRKGFSQALKRLLKLSPWDFIPYPIKDKLKEFNDGKEVRYYSFDSLDRLKAFCRWGYLLRMIKQDEVIVVRLILPERYGKRLVIAALRFRELKEEILGETENVNIVEWGKTYFLINRYFNTNDCAIKDEGIYLGEELLGKKLGSSAFRLFVRRLIESGFGGYPYMVQVENPKLLHLAYEELDGRINTKNIGLTTIFINEFESIGGEYAGKIKEFKKAPKRKAREFLGFLVNLYSQGVSLDWGRLKPPVEGTVPGVAEPRTPKERFEEMLSSSEMLKKYIEDGRIFELIPEWRDWVKLYDNPNFKNYHHLSPEEHLILAFSRLEGDYFWEIIKKYKLRGAGVAHLRRALFLHDFGKIVALQRDPGYSYTSHTKHPEYSAEIAERILLRLGYRPEEIADDILLIRHHEVLKNLAQDGGAEIQPLEFVNLLKNTWDLRLLKVLQLVDAASVMHQFENSLSIGLERRVNEISDIIENILVATGEQRANQERKLLDYLKDIKRQNHEIGLAFGKFKIVLAKHGIKIEEEILQEAFLAMHRSHMGLLRKDGRTPFAIHPIEVATILVDKLGIRNPNWIIAALLHDVLEDTRTTVGAIELIFGKEGKEIASIVRLISKPDISRYASKHEQDIDFYHRIIYGADGIEDRDILTAAQTIKVADRINNLGTLTSGIASSQINETHEVFIHYFIGETEVSVDIKRALIKELITQGAKWKILTQEQIGELEILSKDIIEFKIPELRVEASPYNFIRGLVEYRQEKQPGTPPVLAFNGLSGVGRTTFAGHLQKQLQRVGKKVVVFDANDYLLPRSERDKILQRARQSRVVFHEQREKSYDIDRFRREVWDRLKGFKESFSPTLKFKLSGLYNRLTGRLDASKEYAIDRDTIILIEGIHIFQKDLLPLYDATFFVYAPREVCLDNVLEREKEKPEECRQPEELLRERFELVDWPSYRKHLLEYWRASGFVIDNTDYRNPLVKKNPFPRYPERVPDVPKELIDPQERLNKNLENIFRQLMDKGISPYDIVPGAENHIALFKGLLAVKGVEQLFPSIPLPDRNVDSLDYFLDQLTAQTNIVDTFFKLFAIYMQSLKTLPPIIYKPSFPQDLLLQILSKRKWDEAKFTTNFILYRSNGLYIEVPRVGKIVIGDQERQFVYRHFVLRFINSLLNKYNYIRWVKGLKELSKRLLHYFKPQRIISGEYMRGYRLIMEKAPHLITPTRIIEDDNLWEKIRLKGMARQNKALILQLSEGKLLIDYIHELLSRDAWDEVEKTIDNAFDFLAGLWQFGLADIDPEVNIWENLVVTEDGKIKTCDAESITDELYRVKDYCEAKIKDAVYLPNLIDHRGISEALKFLEADTKTPNPFINIIKTLIDRFGEEDAERLIKIFLDILAKRFEGISKKASETPQGSPAECLKTLFNGRHFANNPITLKDLRQKRINPKTGKPYNVKTIRIELRGLITLGLVQFQRRRGRFEYFLTDRLRRAPPEAILEICNIALTSPPYRTPLLRYAGVTKLNKDEINELREKIREIIHSPKNRLIRIVRDSRTTNSPDILAEYSIRAYGITSNYPAVVGQLNLQDRNQLGRIKDYRLYVHDFQKAPKAVARLSMFRSLDELSVYGDQYVFTGNTLDSMGRLFLGNRLRQLIKLTNYPHYPCAIQLKKGMLYRIWIFDKIEPDKIVDFRQLSTIEDINGTFRRTFYYGMKKEEFDNLGDCVIKGYRLDASGRLSLGTRDAGLGIEFFNCRTEIEVRSGQIKTVKILDEPGRIAKKADFILVYQGGRLIDSFYSDLTQEKFSRWGDVTLKEVWLNSQGILSLDVLGDPAACFTKYPNHKVEVDIINKHVDRVRILDANGSVIRECIFSLVCDEDGNLISSFWTGILEDDFNRLTGTIKRIKTDSNGRLNAGAKKLGIFTNYPDTDAEVDVINGIVDKVRLLKDDKVIEEYEYSLIYDASGKLIDSFREIYSPQERMKLEKATVKRVKLDDHGILIFGGEYWGTFKEYPEHEVEFDVENGVVKEVRILAKDGIKTFLPVLIYKIQSDGTEKLVDSFFEYYYPEKFAKLDNHVIRRFKLDSNGYLDIGGRIGPNKDRRRAQFYPYRDQEVIIYVKNGHVERVTDIAGNYIGKEGDYIKAKEMPKTPKGLPAECLKTLFNGRHFSDNPITLEGLRQGRINPETKKPYDKKAIRVELQGLILLGLVIKEGNTYYLSGKLHFATPELIDQICRINLDKPSPNRSKRLRNTPPLLHYNEIQKLMSIEREELKTKITLIIAHDESDFFREKVGALVAAQKDLIDLEKPDEQERARQNIAMILRRYSEDTSQDKLTQSMAWHVLEGLGMNKDFKGKVVYSLKALLESDLRDDKAKIKELVESTEGRVLFYVGNGCLNAPGYDFPEDRLVTIDKVTDLRNSGERIVFMVEDRDREPLGIDSLTPGQLKGNQFVIPIKGYRRALADISLGLEVIRTNGKNNDMPSLFQLLLIEAIREWLVARGERFTEERVLEILQIDAPPPKKDYLKDIEQSYAIISSA